jgi:uncharacterized protein with NAD-binding domain and iron-sulfur cluster
VHVVVVGAGLAGLTAAIDLIDAGLEVTLVERRPFAGGRTFSFHNDAGDELDNGQHVFLGCCTAYLELLRKLGQSDKAFLQRRLDVRILDAAAGPAQLRETALPPPLHLLPSFLTLPYLSPGEKMAAIAALLFIRLRDLPENETFKSWLESHGQSSNAIQRLWNLIVVPTCNAPVARVSAAMGGFVFREGLLRTRWGGRIGYPRVGLSDILPKRAVEYLAGKGANLMLGSTVDGTTLAADAYILAMPRDQAGWSPIVGVNLWYDRPIFEGEVLAAILDADTFWLFDRTRILKKPGPEHHIAVSISAAEALMPVPRQELAGQVAAKLAKVLPAAREARLLRDSVEKVRAATFVPAPGLERPKATTERPDVFLAGSWTDTGWPDTMEGAIRSGHIAARLAQDFLEKPLHRGGG